MLEIGVPVAGSVTAGLQFPWQTWDDVHYNGFENTWLEKWKNYGKVAGDPFRADGARKQVY